jgi:hypothetical protein
VNQELKITADDMGLISKTADELTSAMENLDSSYLRDGSKVTVVNAYGGYIIGDLVFSAEAEGWLVDLTNYGQEDE